MLENNFYRNQKKPIKAVKEGFCQSNCIEKSLVELKELKESLRMIVASCKKSKVHEVREIAKALDRLSK